MAPSTSLGGVTQVSRVRCGATTAEDGPTPDIRLFELCAAKLPFVSMARKAFAMRMEGPMYWAQM
jgi:hypothetical protein